jgi:hypothetical protein
MTVHKSLVEALRRLQIEQFLESLSAEEKKEMTELSETLRISFPRNTSTVIASKEMEVFMEKFDAYREKQCNLYTTFNLWNSYCEMVELLLTFTRETRTGDWALHMKTTAETMPWFFAYNHTNYSRYMSIYLHEMQNLPSSHPKIHEYLSQGDFVVQLQESHPFSQVACDLSIEVTINRDSKTKGGLIGFSQNPAGVQRWTLAHHERATIYRKCLEMAGESTADAEKTDLTEGRKKNGRKESENLERFHCNSSKSLLLSRASIDKCFFWCRCRHEFNNGYAVSLHKRDNGLPSICS